MNFRNTRNIRAIGLLLLAVILVSCGFARAWAKRQAASDVGVYLVGWAGTKTPPALVFSVRGSKGGSITLYSAAGPTVWTCPTGTITDVSYFVDAQKTEYVDIDGVGQYATINSAGEQSALRPVELHFHMQKTSAGKATFAADVTQRGAEVVSVGAAQSATVDAAPTLPLMKGSAQILH